MKVLNVILGVVIAASAVVAINTASAGATGQTTKCDIPTLPWGAGAGEKMKIEGNKVTASFTVTGTNCTTPVTLAVWKAPSANGQPINKQVLYGFTTSTFGPGNHTISAAIPDCYFQADLLLGSNPKAPDGTANYAYQNGKILTNSPLRDYKYGGNKVCEEPKTPEQPKTPETPVQGGQGGQVQAVATPVELPKTGAGAIAGTFAGVSVSAGAAHAIVRRFKRNK